MARDGSGTYTRVSNSFSNPVAGTTISPTDASSLFDDLQTEMTDSLSRSGKGGMNAALVMGNHDISGVKTAVFQGSTSGNTTVQATAIAGTTTLTLPAATDTLVGKATTDTLTNKTIDTAGTNTLKVNGNTLSASAGTATLTLPNSTDTLVGRATTDTLTNKTISGSSNTLSNVALSSLATQAAYTLVGNATGSSAVPTAVDITALTSKPSPVSGDIVLIQDSAASNAFKRTTVGALSSAGSVASIAGNTGAFTLSGLLTNSVNDLQVNAASKAQQQTGSSATVAVTPSQQQSHDSAAKSFGYATISGGVLTNQKTYNMTLARTGSGTYTATMSTAFDSANYAVVILANKSASILFPAITSQTSTVVSFSIFIAPGFGASDADNVSVVCFGRQ